MELEKSRVLRVCQNVRYRQEKVSDIFSCQIESFWRFQRGDGQSRPSWKESLNQLNILMRDEEFKSEFDRIYNQKILPVKKNQIPPRLKGVIYLMAEAIGESEGYKFSDSNPIDVENMRHPRTQKWVNTSITLLEVLDNYCRDHFGTSLEDLTEAEVNQD